MFRLHIHVEGQTEETFVNEVLRNHFLAVGFADVRARILGNARLRRRRGGIRGWNAVKKDIVNHLREDSAVYSTMLVDFYALPQSGAGAWPGRADANQQPPPLKAKAVEDALAAEIEAEMGVVYHPRRFLPFVMFHEFESLLFSDCEAFGRAIGQPHLKDQFQAIRDEFANPEEINDSPVTAPSKRVLNLVPNYEKPLMGVLAIIEIGLERVRAECPHFQGWLSELEQLVRKTN